MKPAPVFLVALLIINVFACSAPAPLPLATIDGQPLAVFVPPSLNPQQRQNYLREAVDFELLYRQSRQQFPFFYRELLVRDLLKEVASSIAVSPSELRSAVHPKFRKRLGDLDVRRASHILIAAEQGSPDLEQAQQRAAALLNQYLAGADFAELAMQNSADSSAAQGGDLGWFEKTAMEKAFAEKAFSLKEIGSAGLAQTRFGWHVLKLTGMHEQFAKQFGEEVLAEKKKNAIAQHLQELRLRAQIVLYEPVFLSVH